MSDDPRNGDGANDSTNTTQPKGDHSRMVRMHVANVGCIGPDGVTVELDNIVCLVGMNNCGKTTVLRAYQKAVSMAPLQSSDFHIASNGEPPSVELWVHIPDGVENIADKWKESEGSLRLVRSRWQWNSPASKPIRTTWDPTANEYAEHGKAGGLDPVFASRLPQPFLIGSLQDPQEEHRLLLNLVLEPIKQKLEAMKRDQDSPLADLLAQLRTVAEQPVNDFREDLERIQAEVNRAYQQVFGHASIQLGVSLSEMDVDPASALMRGSQIEVQEPHGRTSWNQQGTGSQRALFWSMLQVRSELQRLEDQRRTRDSRLAQAKRDLQAAQSKELKQQAAITRNKVKIKELRQEIERLEANDSDDSAGTVRLPGYMLLIDEPETALHPTAIRAACRHLYRLANDAGWQVMLATHNPVFVDPAADHTTIVRLHRGSQESPPNIYRADEVHFDGDDRARLKALLLFDPSIAEIFFSRSVLIVEGDTEYAAFHSVMDACSDRFPMHDRPLIARARGKPMIAILIRMLRHFKVSFAVLHDVDPPRRKDGRANGMYTENAKIAGEVDLARKAGIVVVHRVSVPDFETFQGMPEVTRDKPYSAREAVVNDHAILESVAALLSSLCEATGNEIDESDNDGANYHQLLQNWCIENPQDNPRFSMEGLDV